MEEILSMATDDSDHPDLRDRGYVYWRLLSTDPEAAKQVVLAEKPVISDDTYKTACPHSLPEHEAGHTLPSTADKR